MSNILNERYEPKTHFNSALIIKVEARVPLQRPEVNQGSAFYRQRCKKHHLGEIKPMNIFKMKNIMQPTLILVLILVFSLTQGCSGNDEIKPDIKDAQIDMSPRDTGLILRSP